MLNISQICTDSDILYTLCKRECIFLINDDMTVIYIYIYICIHADLSGGSTTLFTVKLLMLFDTNIIFSI